MDYATRLQQSIARPAVEWRRGIIATDIVDPCNDCGALALVTQQLHSPPELAFLQGERLTAYLEVSICTACGAVRRRVPAHLLDLVSEALPRE
jgi:hypothetical protein